MCNVSIYDGRNFDLDSPGNSRVRAAIRGDLLPAELDQIAGYSWCVSIQARQIQEETKRTSCTIVFRLSP
jgi:hypothetical protein